MRAMKKILAILLAACLLFSLTGCGIFDTKMARAIQRMSKLDSLHVDLAAALTLDLVVRETETAEASGETEAADEAEVAPAPALESGVTLQGGVACSADWLTDPLLMKMDLQLVLPGKRSSRQAYLEKTDKVFYLYSLLNQGTIWQKEGFTDENFVDVKGIRYIVDGAESFRPAGSDTILGAPADRFDGLLSGEYLEGLLSLYQIRELLADGFGLQLEEDVFQNMGDVPTSIWLDDDSGMIVRVDADLTQAVERIAQKQLAAFREASGVEALGLDLRMKSLVVTAELSQFDEIEPFGIPDEAKAAWGDKVQPWDS